MNIAKNIHPHLCLSYKLSMITKAPKGMAQTEQVNMSQTRSTYSLILKVHTFITVEDEYWKYKFCRILYNGIMPELGTSA